MLYALLTQMCWDSMDPLRFYSNWYAFVKVQSFSIKGNVHALISICVWIYLIEFGPDGTGPLYATCHCDVTCIVHPKQSNWDASVWSHCMWHLCVKIQAVLIQLTPSCVDPLCCKSVPTIWVQIVLTHCIWHVCAMWHALLTKLSCDSMDPQYWICICEVSCIFHGHYMYMYWSQPLCGYILSKTSPNIVGYALNFVYPRL